MINDFSGLLKAAFTRLKSIIDHAPVLLALTLTSCATYQAKELNEQAIAQQNANPSIAQLHIQSSQIKHPLLKPIPFDLSDGLSPDEAAMIAVIQNPELRVARTKQGIATAQVLQAGLLPNPRLAYNFAAVTGGLDQGKVQGYGLSLDWEFTSLLTRSNKVLAAQAEQQSIDLQIAWQEWQVAQAAKLACYQLQIYDQQYALLSESLKRLDSNKEQIQKALDYGWATTLENTTAIIAAEALESRLQAVLQQKQHQQERLNRVLGQPPGQIMTYQATDLPDELITPNFEQLTQDLTPHRLDLLALKQGYQAQEEQLRIAILQQFPKISLGLTHTKNNSNYYTVGAGVALSLPLFDQNQGVITLATASRQLLFDEYSNRDFQSKADVAELLTTITSINTEIKAARTGLSQLETLFNAYTTAHNEHQIDQPTYYAAWNNVTDKHIEVLTLQLHLIEARIALETATGRYAL